jgi:hypothetical protein
VKQFLATSFKEGTADQFLRKAHEPANGGDPNRELVKWKITLDPRGANDAQFRCKHVQYLTETHVPGEEEFLFAAFSVFTVTDFVVSASPATPHRITIEAALDNKLQPDGKPWADLPLAPWC